MVIMPLLFTLRPGGLSTFSNELPFQQSNEVASDEKRETCNLPLIDV